MNANDVTPACGFVLFLCVLVFFVLVLLVVGRSIGTTIALCVKVWPELIAFLEVPWV